MASRWTPPVRTIEDSIADGFDYWKLQLPIMTTGKSNNMLAYTAGKQQIFEYEVNDGFINMIFGQKMKVFVLAKIQTDGQFLIDRVLKEDQWPNW